MLYFVLKISKRNFGLVTISYILWEWQLILRLPLSIILKHSVLCFWNNYFHKSVLIVLLDCLLCTCTVFFQSYHLYFSHLPLCERSQIFFSQSPISCFSHPWRKLFLQDNERLRNRCRIYKYSYKVVVTKTWYFLKISINLLQWLYRIINIFK